MMEAKSDASPAWGERVNDVPTPFYDLLTAMIRAQALEDELIRQHDNARVHVANTVPCVADQVWRVLTQRLNACIAGFIVTAAAGVVIIFLQAGTRQPHVVAAGNDPSEAKSPASVGAAKEPVLRAEGPGRPGKPGVEGERAIEHGITTGSVVAAQSDGPRLDPPVATQPVETLASDAGKLRQVEGAAEVQSSSEATHFDTIAPATNALGKPSPQAAPPQPLSGKTGFATDPGNDPVAARFARTNSHVNMRAGPGNDQAVVMRIPAGSPLQVVKCQHWCEVIFAGQQGWVYKGFVSTPPVPRRP